MTPREVLQALLDRLWERYRRQVPYAARYADLVVEHGGTVANDHLAFRSFNGNFVAQPAGLAATRGVFEALGYHVATEYDFPQMKLKAVHLEHPDADLPRIFVSQLEVTQLDPPVQEAIAAAVAAWAADAPDYDDLLARLGALRGWNADEHEQALSDLLRYFGRPWEPPLRSTVLAANAANQYAAWTLLHGNAVNHFTAYINEQNVAAWPDIETTIDGLRAAGVPMKDQIEGDRGTKLRQSSTQAAEGDFEVLEADGSVGKIHWTDAYYELAERGLIDTPGGPRLFTGFLGPQTPGLFEMTRKRD